MRWLEEFELKHVEMMRTIKAFFHMHEVWNSLASTSKNDGYAGYARRQSANYLELSENAKGLFEAEGDERQCHMNELTFVELVQKFRKEELDWLDSISHTQ